MAGFALSAQAKPTKPPEPEYLKKAHRIEAKAIAATKGMVVRKRGVLTIRYDGKAVAQFTDVRPTECEGFGSCSVWVFDRNLRIFDRPSGAYKTVAVVTRNNGEIDDMFIVYSNGSLLSFDSDPHVSPKGDWLVIGDQENELTEPHLNVIDLKAPIGAGVYESALPCEPKHFLAETEIELSCMTYDAGSFTLQLRRTGKDWKVYTTRKVPINLTPPLQVNTAKGAQYYINQGELDGGYVRLVK